MFIELKKQKDMLEKKLLDKSLSCDERKAIVDKIRDIYGEIRLQLPVDFC